MFSSYFYFDDYFNLRKMANMIFYLSIKKKKIKQKTKNEELNEKINYFHQVKTNKINHISILNLSILIFNVLIYIYVVVVVLI
jgi:hypothetical protein